MFALALVSIILSVTSLGIASFLLVKLLKRE